MAEAVWHGMLLKKKSLLAKHWNEEKIDSHSCPAWASGFNLLR
jgi:hypothetical protein